MWVSNVCAEASKFFSLRANLSIVSRKQVLILVEFVGLSLIDISIRPRKKN